MHLKLSLFSRKLDTLNTITISRSAILNNFHTFQSQFPNSQIWPVLKSNAYGHGITQVASILKKEKFEYFVVDSYYEALKIWSVTRRQVLLIGNTLPSNLKYFNFKKLAITVQDIASLRELISINKKIRIHLKINTGMNRQGIDIVDLPKFLKLITDNKKITLEGVFSHLYDADGNFNDNTNNQVAIFEKCLSQIKKVGFNPKYCHLAATHGSIKINNPQINAIRLGIGLYGFGPIDNLVPVLEFYSHIIKSRIAPLGEKVSYNGTFTTISDTVLATIPVGYFEGYDRRLSNLAFIKYKNNFYQLAGNVCMNLSVFNFSHKYTTGSVFHTTGSASLKLIKPKIFSNIQIISSVSSDLNSIATLASQMNTIPYEVLVKLSPTIRRIIVD